MASRKHTVSRYITTERRTLTVGGRIGADTPALDHEFKNHSEFPRKAELKELVSKNALPVIAPGTVNTDSMGGEEPTTQALLVLRALNAALAAEDAESLESCFFPDQAFWKDQLAMTYHMRTFTNPGVIAASLLETKALRGLAGNFELQGKAQFVPATPVMQFIDCEVAFRTNSPAATCSGRLLLLPLNPNDHESNGDTAVWKIWILSTRLDDLDIHPEDESLLTAPRRPSTALENFQTDVFIVGGGNAAVTLAARLKALGVESAMADRNAHVGDNWGLRYDSMKFHVPTSLCDMPYMAYAPELRAPHLLTRQELSEQVRRFVEAFNLHVIASAEIRKVTETPDKKWHVEIQTPDGIRTVTARHLVQATGIGSQKPYLPQITDRQLYKGVNLHSTQYKNPAQLKDEGVTSVVIVGSANTAFDVLEDFQDTGIHATMLVRSPTYMMPVEHACEAFKSYDSGVEAADKQNMTLPTVVTSQFATGLLAHLASQGPDRYSALAKTGFPVIDSRDPEVSLMHNLLERGGGHYVDTGATSLFVEGKASFRANVEPVAYTATGLRLSDGSDLDTDAIIWCTGFADKNAHDTAADIFKTPLHVDATWGVDEEGEIRGMWKRHSYIDNFWVMGGFTQQHRWHSKTLALQIKAALEGILPPAYRETPHPRTAGQ